MATFSAGESLDLIQLISGVNRRLEQTVAARLKPAGVPIEQYRVLMALGEENGLPMGELAARVFVDSPTLTKIIDRMVANADVYRAPAPGDRRKVLVFLSEKGIETLAHLRGLVEGPEEKLLGQFDRGDATRLRSLLKGLLAS
jgi:DNA-binding MarR family transcriptional regulator